MSTLHPAINSRNDALAAKVIKALESRRFGACYCPTAREAADKVIALIPRGATVSWGGSVTLQEIGIFERLRQEDFPVIDRDTAANMEERHALMRRALTCDTFLTSFNALSEDGVLYNVDGVGNRVAAIAYGPRQVIAVVGLNKVVQGRQEAYQRARTHAGPINAHRCLTSPPLRAPEQSPCIRNGVCGDCKNEGCVCSYIVETRMSNPQGRIQVVLVGENLGF